MSTMYIDQKNFNDHNNFYHNKKIKLMVFLHSRLSYYYYNNIIILKYTPPLPVLSRQLTDLFHEYWYVYYHFTSSCLSSLCSLKDGGSW